MQVSPIKANNTNCTFGIKQQESKYAQDLDKLILNEYGNIFKVHDIESCNLFIETTKRFKEQNAQLLKKHFDIIV